MSVLRVVLLWLAKQLPQPSELVQFVIAPQTLFAQSSAGFVPELELLPPPQPLASRTATKTAASAASLVVETAIEGVSSAAPCRVKEVERPTSGRLGGRSGGRFAARPTAERPGRSDAWTTAPARPQGVAPRALLDEEQRRAEIVAQTLQSVDVAAPFELGERQLA